MMNLQDNLLKALGEHRPLAMDLGDDVILHLRWNEEKEIYEDEMGMTSMKLLVQIAKGEVKVDGEIITLKEEESENV